VFGFDATCSRLGKALARYLSAPIRGFKPVATTDIDALQRCLRPGDVLLVEGNTRVSTAIKYLTQSTWSHAAIYIGNVPEVAGDGPDSKVLVEADLVEGTWAIPLSAYACLHTRVCRPIGMTDDDVRHVIEFVVARLGHKYDLKNVIDLARYLLPEPPVPARWRRRMLALGSGEPTRAICSTLIAQAFQSIRYPILPIADTAVGAEAGTNASGVAPRKVTWTRRHYSLFAPRDFDISPYFAVVKPTLDEGFDHRHMTWSQSDNVDRGKPVDAEVDG
jgi:hypothetical protein